MTSFQIPSHILSSKTKEELKDLVKTLQDRVNIFVSVGTSLSTEKDQDILLENIVTYAKQITSADAATLYMMSDDEKKLHFSIVHTDSMDIRMGGTSGNPINWYPVKLYNDDGSPYLEMVAAYVALKKQTLNFEDVYEVKDFNGSIRILILREPASLIKKQDTGLNPCWPFPC